jgi:hypothetical protein
MQHLCLALLLPSPQLREHQQLCQLSLMVMLMVLGLHPLILLMLQLLHHLHQLQQLQQQGTLWHLQQTLLHTAVAS